ncbi:MAG: DNA (cytosine-5-)-methyltransferase [Bacteroidales bacterium]|nr:DNA (cytosine-5-)-methyltransferase [Bacteroidales bacterium]
MRVLSLFDGISCGQLALRRAGVKIDVYYASEIDKYAIQVTQKNFPNTIQLGDVTQIDFTQFIGKIDLLIGGSPCQDLSIAKKDRKGLEGSRSGLFFKYVEALQTIKPKYFLLENVASMKKEDRDIITEIMGVEPIMINSALLSAQQRKRYYWTNIPNVIQPEDKNVFLKDIIEGGAMSYQDKSFALTMRYSGASFEHDFQKHKKSFAAEPVACALRTWPRTKIEGVERVKRPEIRQDGKSNALTLVNTDSMVCEPVRVGIYGNGGQGQRIYSVNAKSVCLGTGGANKENYKIDLPDGEYIIRKLTPVECERLQTLPDNYTEIGLKEEYIAILSEKSLKNSKKELGLTDRYTRISNTQRYKCIGNGWTVDVIAHIFSFMDEAGEVEYKPVNIFEWVKTFRKRA